MYAMFFVDTVDTKIKACNTFNAICQNSQYKTHSHIPAHNFLNIQPIFNLQKVLERGNCGLFSHTNKYYICRTCRHKTRISNAFNTMCHGCGQLYSSTVGFPIILVGPESRVHAWGPQDPK